MSATVPILVLNSKALLSYNPTTGVFTSATGSATASVEHDVVAGTLITVQVVYSSAAATLEVGVNNSYGTAVAYAGGFTAGTLQVVNASATVVEVGRLEHVGQA